MQRAGGERFSGGRSWQFAPKKATDSPRARPFLTGSAPQTEFDVTRSKQTPENFLTGSRTAIKLFNLCTRRTRDFAWANLHSRDASHGVKAFLLGSASPVENDVTHSKQRLTEFLPGATT